MHVAVVIPAYNAAREVSETIASVVNQTYSDWSLVLVDDGSTDDTLEIANHFAVSEPRIAVVSSANLGVSAARNLGFASSNGAADATLFLDSDDVLEPDSLERLTAALKRSEASVVGVHGLAGAIMEDGQIRRPPTSECWGYQRETVCGWRTRKLREEEPTRFSDLVVWCSIHTPGQVLWRNQALRSVGPWKSMAGEDWEMELAFPDSVR